MQSTLNAPPRVLADTVQGDLVRDAALVAGYATLVGLAAQVWVVLWFTPVPITGQTFAVLLGALALGTRRAVAGMLFYLAAGLAGVPWFAVHRGGWSAVHLPSFGYLIGFVLAAGLAGWLAGRGWDRNPLQALAAMVLANVVIYVAGVAWLSGDLGVSLSRAYELGARPFFAGDLVKAIAAALLLPGAWVLTQGRHSESS
jgi:biotin transport system substrate-specific component